MLRVSISRACGTPEGVVRLLRFGFNGMERDDEISGLGNLNTTEFREIDTRLGGRWWSLDRIVKPWESPYAGFSNNPIYFSDPSGLDPTGETKTNPNDPAKSGSSGPHGPIGPPEEFQIGITLNEAVIVADRMPQPPTPTPKPSFATKAMNKLTWLYNKIKTNELVGLYSDNGQFGDRSGNPVIKIYIPSYLMDMLQLMYGKLNGNKPIKTKGQEKRELNEKLTDERNGAKDPLKPKGAEELVTQDKSDGPALQLSNEKSNEENTKNAANEIEYEVDTILINHGTWSTPWTVVMTPHNDSIKSGLIERTDENVEKITPKNWKIK